MKAIIIGSGVAGLTAGAYLAKQGIDVTVLEQNDDIGGVTSGFRRDGFYWDLGQLVLEGLGPGEQIGNILEDLGITGRVPLIKGDRIYAFPEFTLNKPVEYGGPWWRKEKLISLFPDEEKGISRYYKFYRKFYELITIARRAERASGLSALFLKAGMYLRIIPFLPKMKWSSKRMMDHFFTSEKLQTIFISILADFVVKPSEFPGLGVAAVNPEPAFEFRVPLGISKTGRQPSYQYVDGGCRVLVNALADVITGCGGKIQTGTTVAKIFIEKGKANGVVLGNGTFMDSDLVLATGGARECFLDLVGREHLTEKFAGFIDGIPLMESVFMVHLGIDFDPSEYQQGPLCYYYRTYDIEGAVVKIKSGVYHEGEDGFLLFIPSMAMKGVAPEGMHSVTVYTIAPDTLAGGSWSDDRGLYADRLLKLAEEIIPNLRSRATVKHIITPEEFRKVTHLKHHAFGGCAPVMGKKGAPHKTPVRGLWFLGAQSESGAGINNVMEGAWRTVRLMRKGL